MTRRLMTPVMLGVALVAAQAQGAYTGSLSTPASNGLIGNSAWGGDKGFTISWEITEGVGHFHYKYILSDVHGDALDKDISHVILGTSDNLLMQHIWNVTPDLEITIGEHKTAQGNPGMPGDLYGIKFDEVGPGVLTLEFYSRRRPMWADFYAKDGRHQLQDVYVYNADFGVAVANLNDYTAASALDGDGNTLFKILAPDTLIIPAPGAVVLAWIGLGLIGWTRRRLA